MLRLIDVRERTGAYWAAYQRKRLRNKIIHNPDYVPDWFIQEVVQDRVSWARCEIEQFTHSSEALEVFKALRVLEKFVSNGDNSVGQRDVVIAALAGAAEVEEERDRRLAGDETAATPVDVESVVDYARKLEQDRNEMYAAIWAVVDSADATASDARSKFGTVLHSLKQFLKQFDPIEPVMRKETQ